MLRRIIEEEKKQGKQYGNDTVLHSIPRPKWYGPEAPQQPKPNEDIRGEFIKFITDILETKEGLEAIEKVTVVRFSSPGVFEIEVHSRWDSEDLQPNISYDMIVLLAKEMIDGGLTREEGITLGGGEDFVVHITTYSALGEYRYQSDTDYETLTKLNNKQMSYEEWVTAANAGFR